MAGSIQNATPGDKIFYRTSQLRTDQLSQNLVKFNKTQFSDALTKTVTGVVSLNNCFIYLTCLDCWKLSHDRNKEVKKLFLFNNYHKRGAGTAQSV
jgi:hypothetical protein